MKEISYAKKQLKGHNGKLLDLAYSILITDESQRTVCYGVRIEERNESSLIQVLDLTTEENRIYDLMDQLSRNSVTPIGLHDVLADWL